MNVDRERFTAGPVAAGREPGPLVPMLPFLVGVTRAVAALVRFCADVVCEPGPDPLTLEPRILHSA